MNSGKCVGPDRVFLSHMNNTAGNCLDQQQENVKSRDIMYLIPLQKSCVFCLQQINTVCSHYKSACISLSFLVDIFVCVFYVFGSSFSSWDICILLVFFIIASVALNFLLVYHLHSYTKSSRKSLEQLIQTFAFSNTGKYPDLSECLKIAKYSSSFYLCFGHHQILSAVFKWHSFFIRCACSPCL